MGPLKWSDFILLCNWFYKGPPWSVHDPRSFDDELVRSRSHHSDARGGCVGILQQRSVDVEPRPHTESLGVRELLTWNTHGTRMNADLYEDVFFLKLKYGHFHPCHYKCKCIRHLIFFDLTFSQHFVNYLYIPTWNQRVFVLGQEFTFPETNMFLPI